MESQTTPHGSLEPLLENLRRSAGFLRGLVAAAGAATAFGFAVVAARLMAAELPVSEGLDLFGVRGVIATGVRGLALPIVLGIVVALPLAAFNELVERRPKKSGGDEPAARRARIALALASVPLLALLVLLIFAALARQLTPDLPRPVVIAIYVVIGAVCAWFVWWAVRRQQHAIWVRLLLVAPLVVLLCIVPMAYGLAAALAAAGLFWLIRPGNERRLDQLARRDSLIAPFLVASLLATVTGYVLSVALTPPTMFHLARVRLDSGRTLTGGFVGRVDGGVTLVTCRPLASRPAVSRRARFVVVPAGRVRSLSITRQAYVVNPGRSRTALGALAALASNLGVGIHDDLPFTTGDSQTTGHPVCGR